MSTLLSWVLAATTTLAPTRTHEPLATAITTVVEREAPLFRDDADKKKTAAFLVAVAFRESSLKPEAVGDRVGKKKTPTSFCAYQINLPWGRKTPEGWTGEELTEDPLKCVSVAYRMMQQSARACPEHPLAWYAEGPTGCTSERAKRISRDRMALAAHLRRTVSASDVQEGQAEREERSFRTPVLPLRPRERLIVASRHATPGARHTCSP
jgi:hypothetical protein